MRCIYSAFQDNMEMKKHPAASTYFNKNKKNNNEKTVKPNQANIIPINHFGEAQHF